MLQHGRVQAVDCTSFQGKMSSQNSRRAHVVGCRKGGDPPNARVNFLQNPFGRRGALSSILRA
jgi:hypothetical protein